MSRIWSCLIILSVLGLSSCFIGTTVTDRELSIQNTGNDPSSRSQLSQQQDFLVVINSKGHPQTLPGISSFTAVQYLSDSDFTKSLRAALTNSSFALKKKISAVEEIDPDTTPYLYLLEIHNWDPCVMYISYTNFENKEYYETGGGYWLNNQYYGDGGLRESYLKITFTIQIIFYGKYQDQYTLSKEIIHPSSDEDIFSYLAFNFRIILDEFYNRRIGY
jgi:hypothetical protein